MPKPRKKSSAKSAPAKRINKTAWIRSQPPKLPAKEVVGKAKAQGIKLSLAQVYTARSSAKKLTPITKRSAAGGTSKAITAADGGGDLRHQFIAIAVRLGTDEAQRLLDRLVDVQTPMP
jgi:hypothetical protein